MGPLTSTPFIAFLAINHGTNGWSEAWHLPEKDIASSRTTVAELALARSYLLPAGYVLEWAAVRQVGVGPYIEWAAITDPLQPLPQWGTCHADALGLLWRFQTADGKWANHLFRGIDDDDIEEHEWTYRGLQVGSGIVPLSDVPALCTKDNLYEHVLSVFRQKTCHARKVDPNDPSDPWFTLTPWEDTIYRRVTKRNVGSRYNRVSWEATNWTQSPGFTPCGTAVTVLRSCYYADCRFFSAGPTQSILYYNAKPGAAVFDMQTIFWGWARDKEIANATDPGEDTGPGARSYSLGLSWGDAPGLVPDGTQEQFLGLSIPPWGNDPDTPPIYRIPCDMPAPIPITVDDDPGAVTVLDVTRLSFHEDDFTVEEVAPGWAKVRVKFPDPPDAGLDKRDWNAWRAYPPAFPGRWYVAGAALSNTGTYDYLPLNTAIAVPFIPGAGGTIEAIGFQVDQVLVTGKKARIAIFEAYDADTPVPGVVLDQSDEIDISTIGVKEYECHLVLRPDRLYFLVIVTNQTATQVALAAISPLCSLPIFGTPADNIKSIGQAVLTNPWSFDVFTDSGPGSWSISDLDAAPALAVRFESSSLEPLDYMLGRVSLVLDISAEITTFTPASASMTPEIEFVLAPEAATSEYAPASVSMTPVIEFVLDPTSAMAESIPASASMTPVIEFTLESSGPATILTFEERYPGTVTDAGGGDSGWNNVGNASTINATYADCFLDATDTQTNQIAGLNYGFTLPGAAVVLGIESLVNWYEDPSGQLAPKHLGLVGPAIAAFENHAGEISLTDVPTTWTAGAWNDPWGESLVGSDVNHVNFGMFLEAQVGAPGNSGTVYLDGMGLRVWYSA